jgi:hypothetical protein
VSPSPEQIERAIVEATATVDRLRDDYYEATAAAKARRRGAQAWRDALFARIAQTTAEIERLRRQLRHTCPNCIRLAEHQLYRTVCDRHAPYMGDG